MTVQFDQVIFAYSMEEIYSVGATRFLRDRGPNQFDMQFPGGAADPTPTLDAGLSFDGNDYLSLPAAQLARFYAAMPTGPYTWFAAASSTIAAGASSVLFSCYDAGAGGTFEGIACQYYTQAVGAGRGILYNGNGGGAASYEISAAAEPYLPLSGRAVLAATVEAAPRGLHKQAVASYSWGAGVYAAPAYDATVVPRLGCTPTLGAFMIGRQYYLALLRGAASSQDLSELSRLIAEGSQKPFCWRQP